MNWSALLQESEFVAFTKFHFIPMIIFLIIGVIAVLVGRSLQNQESKTKLGVMLSFIPFSSVITAFVIRCYYGLDISDDLPFYLCRTLSLIMPFIMWKRDRFWLGICYFLIIVGTLNANITPDIEFGFPHWSYFNYWFQHSGLIILPIYAIFVYELRINWKDFFNAYIAVNIYLVFSLVVNFLLGGNYMYSMHKPPGGSLLDIMGPWPWYLVTGQVFAIVLCGIAIAPFLIYNYLVKKIQNPK